MVNERARPIGPEFLDLIVAVGVVNNTVNAIERIERFGVDIGITTDRLHVRELMALEELMSKCVIRGGGEIRI